MTAFGTFSEALKDAKVRLRNAPLVKSGHWQGISTTNRPEMATHELLNYSLTVEHTNLPAQQAAHVIGADIPWADEHFEERVCGQPLNPPPSEERWPHAPKGNNFFKKNGIFSHTYPERYWPKYAGGASGESCGRIGIRHRYGDMWDLIDLLIADPHTRQAYLPVWFPEDLGASIDARKPCTLGYQFILRNGELHIVYFIRSCDFVRHFRNDIYMTWRLQQWVLEELQSRDPAIWSEVVSGTFTMHITSLHIFVNDYIKEFGHGSNRA